MTWGKGKKKSRQYSSEKDLKGKITTKKIINNRGHKREKETKSNCIPWGGKIFSGGGTG